MEAAVVNGLLDWLIDIVVWCAIRIGLWVIL